MDRRLKFGSLAVVALGITLGLYLRAGGDRPASSGQVVSQSSSFLDGVSGGTVESAYDSLPTPPAVPGPRAAVLPHHDVASRLMAELALSLRDAEPRTIVLVGPDHKQANPEAIVVSAAAWRWNGTTIPNDEAVVAALRASGNVTVNEALIQSEHSVLVPLPFLLRQFPDSRYVLLTVRGGEHRAALEDVTTILDQALGPGDLVVASVDFSHYLPLPQAEVEDARSRRALEAVAPDALQTVAADSPNSLVLALQFAQRRGATSIRIINHSNSAHELGILDLQSTTSYFTAVWH